jgi:hypothetical protein
MITPELRIAGCHPFAYPRKKTEKLLRPSRGSFFHFAFKFCSDLCLCFLRGLAALASGAQHTQPNKESSICQQY